MKQKYPYHTSLRPQDVPVLEGEEADPRVFVHDLSRGLPSVFDKCDLIYSEPPWRSGFVTFMARAGVAGNFDELVVILAGMCRDANASRPVVLVTGKRMLRRLPSPLLTSPGMIDSNNRVLAECQISCWGSRLDVGGRTSLVIKRLAEQFSVVGDPCCGYGNTGRIFAELGRDFVLSDVNASCVEYVSRATQSWSME